MSTIWRYCFAGFVLATSIVPAFAAGPRTKAVCWIDRERPTTANELSVTDPRVAPMRAAAHTFNAILKKNQTLQSLPEVRIRSTWQVSGHPDATTKAPFGVHVVLWAHGRSVWGSGDCDLIPEADRITPRAAVVLQVNSVNSTLTQKPSYVQDDVLHAYVEPEVIGRVGSHPVYKGQWIVLTYNGKVPWVPLTMGEYLDYEERRLLRDQAETTQNIEEAEANTDVFDEEALREAYEAMRAVSAEEAEKFLKMMEETRKEVAAAMADAPPMENPYTQMLADLRAFRASLTPAQLQAQAREGYTSATPLAPIEHLDKLVKLDPAFPWKWDDPNEIRLMEIHYSGAGAPYDALMRKAIEELDWSAVEGLLR